MVEDVLEISDKIDEINMEIVRVCSVVKFTLLQGVLRQLRNTYADAVAKYRVDLLAKAAAEKHRELVLDIVPGGAANAKAAPLLIEVGDVKKPVLVPLLAASAMNEVIEQAVAAQIAVDNGSKEYTVAGLYSSSVKAMKVYTVRGATKARRGVAPPFINTGSSRSLKHRSSSNLRGSPSPAPNRNAASPSPTHSQSSPTSPTKPTAKQGIRRAPSGMQLLGS